MKIYHSKNLGMTDDDREWKEQLNVKVLNEIMAEIESKIYYGQIPS